MDRSGHRLFRLRCTRARTSDPHTACGAVLSLCIVAILSMPAFAQPIAYPPIPRSDENSNVLVLYNADSRDGTDIAHHYASRRPGVRLLGLNGVPAGEEVSVDQYLTQIRPQVLAGLTTDIDYIVTTKGLPLRIYNNHSIATFPHSYVDPQGVQRTIFSDTYKRYSSFESELTRIDKFQTWKQIGDQTWWMPPTGANPTSNPYFKRDAAFSRQDPANDGIRLTSRLDGFSAGDVKMMIDRAARPFILPFDAPVLIDDSPAAAASGVTSMPSLAQNVLEPRGQSFRYDNTILPMFDEPRSVLGYVSHGTNDGSGLFGPDYITNLDFALANGAVFHSWESFNAVSFEEGANQGGQALIGDWIRKGGTAALGHVQEPGANLSSVTNEDRFFQMLLDGYNLAEAAWNATRQLSYVNTVIGDPLMTWQRWLSGDNTMDGVVDARDFAVLADHWLAEGSIYDGDCNGDGFIDSADYAILAEHWGRAVPNTFTLSAVGPVPPMPTSAVPEPTAAVTLLALSALACRSCRRRAS